MESGRANSVRTAAARADPLLFERKLEKNASSPTAECRGRVWEGLGGHLWAWPGRAGVRVRFLARSEDQIAHFALQSGDI